MSLSFDNFFLQEVLKRLGFFGFSIELIQGFKLKSLGGDVFCFCGCCLRSESVLFGVGYFEEVRSIWAAVVVDCANSFCVRAEIGWVATSQLLKITTGASREQGLFGTYLR